MLTIESGHGKRAWAAKLGEIMDMLNRRLRLFASSLFVLILLGACSSGVTRSPEMSAAPFEYFGTNGKQAGQISIRLTPEAEAVAVTTLRFDRDQILRLARQGLEIRNALTKEPVPTLPSIEIIVNSVRSRSTFNAMMFGFMAGDDHIKGDVVVRSPDGIELQRFGVSASYALGGFGGGQTDARMGWLYETFAKHVVEELAGKVPSPPAETPTS